MSGLTSHSAPLSAAQIIEMLTVAGFTASQSAALQGLYASQAEVVSVLTVQGFEFPHSYELLEGLLYAL